ncbi:helix-turn-helix transcriptional regulator [Chryseobacterium sp. RP-3-3]|uniref:Helix-turn-helix transcriptional regulator n=1 Tax=Chryseobacterium antibioticum TaxID=2728847 RepID=A0A7Y0AMQ8_9FLAO|nr:helix-turn-helix transcriptional regulator [Chryseobacterium antibioticum]NML70082.1 helix-turn-helix transcriptional regulator [Chryseobacterium antibioticum]
MMRFYISLFLVIIFQLTFSQVSKNEAIINQLDEIKTTNPSLTISISSKLLKEKLSLRDQAYVYRALGYANISIGKYSTAQEYIQKAYDVANESGDTLCKIKTTCSMGEWNGMLGLYSEMDHDLSRALKLSRLLNGDNYYTAITKINTIKANMYVNQDKHTLAKKYILKNLSLLKNIKNVSNYNKTLTLSYLGLGDIYNRGTKKADSAIYFYEKGLNIVLKSPDKINLYKFYIGLAEAFAHKKEYNKGIDLCHIALKIKHNSDYEKVFIFKSISKLYLEANKTKEAQIYSDSATIFEEKGEKHLLEALNETNNNKIKTIENKEKQISLLSIIIPVLIGIFILITIFYYLNLKKQKKKFQNYIENLNNSTSTPSEIAIENLSAVTPEINSELEIEILQKLKIFEKEEKFRDKEISLPALAALLNTNTNYLSRIINDHYSKNFNSYINELRINYITKKIAENPVYRNYKISFLAEDCGFVSHSAFSTKFKEITGISPSQFLSFASAEK